MFPTVVTTPPALYSEIYCVCTHERRREALGGSFFVLDGDGGCRRSPSRELPASRQTHRLEVADDIDRSRRTDAALQLLR